MPRITWIALLVATLVGCAEHPQPGTGVTATPPSTTQTTNYPPPVTSTDPAVTAASADQSARDRFVKEAREAWSAFKDLAAESRDEFVAESREQLAEVDRRLDVLKARAAEASENTKDDIQREIGKLEEHRAEFRKRLDEVSAASEDAWKDVAQGASNAWTDLKNAFGRAAEHFEDRPADGVPPSPSPATPPRP